VVCDGSSFNRSGRGLVSNPRTKLVLPTWLFSSPSAQRGDARTSTSVEIVTLRKPATVVASLGTMTMKTIASSQRKLGSSGWVPWATALLDAYFDFKVPVGSTNKTET